MPQKNTPHYQLRPVTDSNDGRFLLALFEDSRSELFSMLPLEEAQKNALIQQQFNLQAITYAQEYPPPAAEHLIIEQNSKAIGQLYTYTTPSDIRIVDISLIAPKRRQGIGSAVLDTLLQTAFTQHKTLSLSVEQHNPAYRLYEKKGFKITEVVAPYVCMSA